MKIKVDVDFVMKYYETWGRLMGLQYKVKKWRKHFEGFYKFCKDNDVNILRFVDYIFINKKKLMPWQLDKVDYELIKDFKKNFFMKSIIESIVEEKKEWDKLVNKYKDKAFLFLIYKGDVKITDYLSSENAKRKLRKIGFDWRKIVFYKSFESLIKEVKDEQGNWQEDTQKDTDGFEICYEIR